MRASGYRIGGQRSFLEVNVYTTWDARDNGLFVLGASWLAAVTLVDIDTMARQLLLQIWHGDASSVIILYIVSLLDVSNMKSDLFSTKPVANTALSHGSS